MKNLALMTVYNTI